MKKKEKKEKGGQGVKRGDAVSCPQVPVTIGSVVAVLADDDEYDYYLMKVSKVPFLGQNVQKMMTGETHFRWVLMLSGVIIITEGNKIHLNMNLFEEGQRQFIQQLFGTLRILNPVTPSLFVNVCMKTFLKAWNHRATDLIWNVICFFFLPFLCMTCFIFTTLHNTRLSSLFLCVFLSFFLGGANLENKSSEV